MNKSPLGSLHASIWDIHTV